MYKGSERMNQIDHIAIAVFSIQKTALVRSIGCLTGNFQT